jgi:hypothetical protein
MVVLAVALKKTVVTELELRVKDLEAEQTLPDIQVVGEVEQAAPVGEAHLLVLLRFITNLAVQAVPGYLAPSVEQGLGTLAEAAGLLMAAVAVHLLIRVAREERAVVVVELEVSQHHL